MSEVHSSRQRRSFSLHEFNEQHQKNHGGQTNTDPIPAAKINPAKSDPPSYPDISSSSAQEKIEKINPNNQSRLPIPSLLAFIALNLSIFLVALDTVLLPTALPTISQSFNLPDALYAWTGSAYLIANAASVPFWGKLSDVFGRKSVMVVANAIFLTGSVFCAFSVNAVMLVAGRTVQGLGGGGVVVLVHVCVSDLFSIRDRSFYMGTVGAVWAFASALGPVLGGILAEKLDWRWCFYINLPIISISIIVLHFTLHLKNPQTPLAAGLASMDWLGTCIILTATILLLVGLQTGGTTSYKTPLVISFLVLSCLAYIIFPFAQWWEDTRGGNPIMPLRIFMKVNNLSALGVCACDALVFNSIAYFLPLYLQIVLGKSPSASGLYMLAIAIPLTVVSLSSGYIIERTGHFLEVLQAGLLVMTVGVGLLISLDPALHPAKVICILVVLGLGFGPNFSAPLIALQTHISEADIAAGTAAFGFVRMMFGAVGLVVGQVVFQLLMIPHFDDFVDANVAHDIAVQLAGGEAIAQTGVIAALPLDQRIVLRRAFLDALRGTWIVYTVVAALGLVVSFGIKRTRLSRRSDEIIEDCSQVANRELNISSLRDDALEK